MSRPRSQLPAYRKHSSGSAVCTVRLANGSRKEIILGTYGSADSKREHLRICTLVTNNEGTFPTTAKDLTVSEAVLAYVRFANLYYGDGSSGLAKAKRSLRAVRKLFGGSSAADFGPKSFKTIQDQWVAEGYSRKTINGMTSSVKQAFRWMVSEEILPAETLHRLQSVTGLRIGRTAAIDLPPVKPADAADLDKALRFMPPMIAAICELQARSGARCGELLRIKVRTWIAPAPSGGSPRRHTRAPGEGMPARSISDREHSQC